MNDTISIRLLTYNFYLRPPFIKANQSDFKTARTRLFARTELSRFDIIGFQEVFWGFRKRDLLRLAKDRGFKYAAYGPSPSMHDVFKRKIVVDSGLLLISKYPIVSSKTVIFKDACNLDGGSTKGALYALVQVDEDRYLNVIVLHGQASYNDFSHTSPEARVRQGQYRQLVEWIPAVAMKDTPIIVMGDFNVDALFQTKNKQCASIEYQSLLEMFKDCASFGFHDLIYASTKTYSPTFAVPGYDAILTDRAEADTNQALDHVFYAPGDTNYHGPLSSFDGTGWRLMSRCVDSETHLDVKIERFLIPESRVFVDTTVKRGLTQLSDHFGISVGLECRPRTVHGQGKVSHEPNTSKKDTKSTYLIQNTLYDMSYIEFLLDMCFRAYLLLYEFLYRTELMNGIDFPTKI